MYGNIVLRSRRHDEVYRIGLHTVGIELKPYERMCVILKGVGLRRMSFKRLKKEESQLKKK